MADEFSVNDLRAMEEIRHHEGFRASDDGAGTIGYYDSEGYLTNGIGHRVFGAKREKGRAGESVPSIYMSWEDTNRQFERDYVNHRDGASQSPFWDKASPEQQRALVNIGYNMGDDWWKTFTRLDGSVHEGFPKFTEAASSGDWEAASNEMVDSKWFEQVGERGPDVISMMRPPAHPEQGTPMEQLGSRTPDEDRVIGMVSLNRGGY